MTNTRGRVAGLPSQCGAAVRLHGARRAADRGGARNRLSLQHIRQVINRLRASYDRPLTELRFAVQDRNLYFQHPDGTWEGGQRPGQIVLADVVMLEEVRADLRRACRAAP